MIDLRELRVGNMVKCLTHLPIGYYVSSFPYTKILEIKSDSVETEAGNHKYREIAPIPLTETLLLKWGGNKTENNLIIFPENQTDIIPVSIVVEEEKLYFGNLQNKYSQNIESVHQFQNLYYALKGDEIKLHW